MLTLLETKIAHLRRSVPEVLLADLERAFGEWRDAAAISLPLPAAVFPALEIELLYCLARHRPWLATPMFREFVVEFLSRDYRLERCAGETVFNMLAFRFDLGGTPPRFADDQTANREFLRYVFVASACARDEEALHLQLGLGEGILRHLRRAAQNIIHPGKRAATATPFVPALDALISEVMIELSSQMKRSPWALDLHRLRHHLLLADLPWGPVLAEHGTDWIFVLLQRIGGERHVGEDAVAAWFDELQPVKTQRPPGVSSAELLALLARHDLAFLCDASGGESGSARWQLTAFAQELTAEAFAHDLLSRRKRLPRHLGKLNASYQTAVLRRFQGLDAEGWVQLLATEGRGLAPGAVEVLVRRSFKHAGEARTIAPLEEFMRAATLPRARVAACRAMETAGRCEDLDAFLCRIAETDESAAVRACAATVLERRTESSPGCSAVS